jgi:hypothetical protein
MSNEQGLRTHRRIPEDNDISMSTRVARANTLNKTYICVLVAVHSNAYGVRRTY